MVLTNYEMPHPIIHIRGSGFSVDFGGVTNIQTASSADPLSSELVSA